MFMAVEMAWVIAGLISVCGGEQKAVSEAVFTGVIGDEIVGCSGEFGVMAGVIARAELSAELGAGLIAVLSTELLAGQGAVFGAAT